MEHSCGGEEQKQKHSEDGNQDAEEPSFVDQRYCEKQEQKLRNKGAESAKQDSDGSKDKKGAPPGTFDHLPYGVVDDE